MKKVSERWKEKTLAFEPEVTDNSGVLKECNTKAIRL
jgi:hypothetical protein